LPENKELEKASRELDLHYIPSRYPDAFPSGTPTEHYDEDKGRQALEWAKKVLEFVKRNF